MLYIANKTSNYSLKYIKKRKITALPQLQFVEYYFSDSVSFHSLILKLEIINYVIRERKIANADIELENKRAAQRIINLLLSLTYK